MSRTYVIADLHGRADLLREALNAIERRRDGQPATIITLGDYIDRGPDSRLVVERLMAGSPSADVTMVNLKGNHEAMMLECQGSADPTWRIHNGGDTTLSSYGGVVPEDHLDWAKRLKLCHTDTCRIYVHAGVDPGLSIDRQDEQFALWVRYGDDPDVHYPDKHIVHGHTPARNGPQLFSGRTNLDTGAFHTGRLVIGVFDDAQPGGPIDLMEVTA